MDENVLSPRLRWISAIGKWAALTIVVIAAVFYFTDNMVSQIIGHHWAQLSPDIQEVVDYSASQHLLLKVMATLKYVSPVIVVIGTWRVLHIFHRGNPLSMEAMQALRFLGTTIILYALFGILFYTAMTLALTYNNPPGSKTLAIALDTQQIMTLLIGAVIWMCGHVFVQAVQAVEENRQII